MHLPLIEVAVAIVHRSDGRVLLAERTARQMGAGFWELPGGKIEPGEGAAQAAVRELVEEVGLLAHRLRPAIRYDHAYRTRRLRMHFFRVEHWSGTPEGREGQRLAWVDPAQPEVGPLQQSNERVLRALALPALYADCRPRSGDDVPAQLATVRCALAAGARMVRIGGRGLTADQRVGLARRAQAHASEHGAQIVLDGGTSEVQRAGLSSLHACTERLRRLSARPQVPLWIASCHGQQDLVRAMALGADAAVVSPVLATDGSSGGAPLGWEAFAQLARQSAIPLYAQGGLRPELLATARAHGAIGIACPLPQAAVGMRDSGRRGPT